MALAIYVKPVGLHQKEYDEALRQLEAAGASAPPGRIYHVCFEVDGSLQVVDVWDSEEAANAFVQTLIPILASQGVEMTPPTIGQVHNIIIG